MSEPSTALRVRPRALTGARPALAWLLTVPVIAIGSQAAHALDYQLVIPGSRRAAVLAATGHQYLDLAPQFLAISLALICLALVWRVAGKRVDTPGAGVPAWAFAALPPLAFALQEHLERLLHTGHVPWEAALEPTFLPGVLLQLPFAFLAFALARALLGAAALVSRLLQRAQRPLAAPPRRAAPRPRSFIGGLPAPLACGRSLRGPPPPLPA